MHQLVKSLVVALMASLLPVSAMARWAVQVETNPMTGVKKVHAESMWERPSERFSFPYENAWVSIIVTCYLYSKNVEVELHRNTDSPELSTADYKNHRLKFDDGEIWTPEWHKYTGFASIGDNDKSKAIELLKSSSTVLVEAKYKGHADRYIKISLKKSTAAINEALAACK